MSNKAAWLTEAKAKPFKIDDAPIPTPEAHEIVIKNRAIAINPVDAMIQIMGIIIKTYPTILGSDVAGEVVAVGQDVKNFKVGDRVIAQMDGLVTGKPSGTGFQLHSAANTKIVAKIPDSITYAQGSVLPLALSTAAVGMFAKNCLGLPYPQLNPSSNGKVLLVWGGSSSVGSCAIQMGKAAGLEVATTASAHNHQFVRDLGADYIFDHSSPQIVDEVVKKLHGCSFAGAYDAIQDEDTIIKCAQIASQLEGTKFVATVRAPGMPLPDLPGGVKACTTFGLPTVNEGFDHSLWGEWVPAALANGQLKCKPDPLVIGHGLEALQEACDKWAAGVSGKKIVVELP